METRVARKRTLEETTPPQYHINDGNFKDLLGYIISDMLHTKDLINVLRVCKHWKSVTMNSVSMWRGNTKLKFLRDDTGEFTVDFTTKYPKTIIHMRNSLKLCSNEESVDIRLLIRHMDDGSGNLMGRMVELKIIDILCCNEMCWLARVCCNGLWKCVVSMVNASKEKPSLDQILKIAKESLIVNRRNAISVLALSKFDPTISSNYSMIAPEDTFGVFFYSACSLGYTDAIKYFSLRCQTFSNNDKSSNPLLLACENGHTEALDLLLKLGHTTRNYVECLLTCKVSSKIKEIASILCNRPEISASIDSEIMDNYKSIISSIFKLVLESCFERAKILLRRFIPWFSNNEHAMLHFVSSMMSWISVAFQNNEQLEDYMSILLKAMASDRSKTKCNTVKSLRVIDTLFFLKKYKKQGPMLDSFFDNHKDCDCIIPTKYSATLYMMEENNRYMLKKLLQIYNLREYEHHLTEKWLFFPEDSGKVVGKAIEIYANTMQQLQPHQTPPHRIFDACKGFLDEFLSLPKWGNVDFCNSVANTVSKIKYIALHIIQHLSLTIQYTHCILDDIAIENILIHSKSKSSGRNLIIRMLNGIKNTSDRVTYCTKACRLATAIMKRQTIEEDDILLAAVTGIDMHEIIGEDSCIKDFEECIMTSCMMDRHNIMSILINKAVGPVFGHEQAAICAFNHATRNNSFKCIKVLLKFQSVIGFLENIVT
jgi:hypothetical protein